MTTMPAATDDRRAGMTGSVMVACIVATVAILFTGISAVMILASEQSVARRAIEVDQAFMLAEAAADLSFRELSAGRDFATDEIGFVAGDVDPGEFVATVQPAYAGPGAYTIVATGRVATVARTIRVSVARDPGPPGFIGYDGITLSGNPLIDTYDSSLGPYGSQAPGRDVKVASNGNITLNGGAQILGDATPGPGGSVRGAAGVSGSTAPASSPMTVPTYTYSPPIASMGAWSGAGAFTGGTYRYSTFSLTGQSSVTISGNVVLYVDGNFSISGQAFTNILPGGNLTIHHGSGTFTVSGGGVINQSQMPSNLTINSATTRNVTLSGNSAFYGTLNAPYAALNVTGTADLFGAARARTLSLTGTMRLHYDRGLGAGGPLAVKLMRPLGRTARRS